MSRKNIDGAGIKRSRWREIWRLFRKNRPAMIGLVLLILILLVSIFADVIVPYDRALDVSSDWLQPPSSEHPFGTDNVGRDLFARVVHGSRYSLVIGIVATTLSLAVGAFIGAACGYFGGWLDNVVMRLFDVIASIPGMLLILVLVMALGQSVENLLWALMISGVPGYARFVRATVLNLSDTEYVQCARSYGTGNFRIIMKHVLPNAMGPDNNHVCRQCIGHYTRGG